MTNFDSFFRSLQIQDFRIKIGSFLPSIPKKENQGKSDFKTIRKLVEYIKNEDQKKKIDSFK